MEAEKTFDELVVMFSQNMSHDAAVVYANQYQCLQKIKSMLEKKLDKHGTTRTPTNKGQQG